MFYLVTVVVNQELEAVLAPLLGVQRPIHFLHWLAVVFVATVVLMVAISAWQPDRRLHQPEPGLTVDLSPWRWAKPVSGLIVLGTLATYIMLAQ
jgi:SSS family solute:Na+ symporter